LTKDEYDLDVKPLLRIVLGRFFGGSTGLVDMLVQHVPSPVTAARRKVEHIYTVREKQRDEFYEISVT
jgi:U5 small nuclear ribonucleoprotein component